MSKAAISLTTGLEDAEKVTVAFLVAVGAAESGRETLIFLTKEAVRLAVDGFARTQPAPPAESARSPAASPDPRRPLPPVASATLGARAAPLRTQAAGMPLRPQLRGPGRHLCGRKQPVCRPRPVGGRHTGALPRVPYP